VCVFVVDGVVIGGAGVLVVLVVCVCACMCVCAVGSYCVLDCVLVY
jgi:hypothetical protein